MNWSAVATLRSEGAIGTKEEHSRSALRRLVEVASLSFFWGSETKTPDGQKGNKGFSGRALADIRASVDIQHTLIIHDHVCDTLPQANKIVAKQPFILQCGIHLHYRADQSHVFNIQKAGPAVTGLD